MFKGEGRLCHTGGVMRVPIKWDCCENQMGLRRENVLHPVWCTGNREQLFRLLDAVRGVGRKGERRLLVMITLLGLVYKC